MKETEINLGQGLKTNTWTFNGMIPGPTLEVCVGDKVTIHLANNGSVAHGLDTHAFRIDARKFGPIEPEEINMIEATVDTPGVYMYHCAAGPITDQHIKMNMSGVMIVYDRNVVLPPAKEIAVLRGAVFGTPDDSGMIYSDSKHMDMNAHGIKKLIDIRTIPKSRYNPQFNQDKLRVSLKKAGIGYQHLKELGGLRRHKKDSINIGWRNLSFRGFADYMQTADFEKGLNRLKKIAKQKRTVIMCAEAVPWRCHRYLVADALTKQGWSVLHIQSRKTAKPYQLTKFVRARGGKLYYLKSKA